jgi:hypothetical protein
MTNCQYISQGKEKGKFIAFWRYVLRCATVGLWLGLAALVSPTWPSILWAGVGLARVSFAVGRASGRLSYPYLILADHCVFRIFLECRMTMDRDLNELNFDNRVQVSHSPSPSCHPRYSRVWNLFIMHAPLCHNYYMYHSKEYIQ